MPREINVPVKLFSRTITKKTKKNKRYAYKMVKASEKKSYNLQSYAIDDKHAHA